MASGCVTVVRVQPEQMNCYVRRQPDAGFIRIAGSKANNNIASTAITSGSNSSTTKIRVGSEHPKVVHSVSCRQMFLSSYTFSRRVSARRQIKRFGRSLVGLFRCMTTRRRMACEAKGQVAVRMKRRRCLVVARGAKKVSSSTFLAVFRRLFCGASTKFN